MKKFWSHVFDIHSYHQILQPIGFSMGVINNFRKVWPDNICFYLVLKTRIVTDVICKGSLEFQTMWLKTLLASQKTMVCFSSSRSLKSQFNQTDVTADVGKSLKSQLIARVSHTTISFNFCQTHNLKWLYNSKHKQKKAKCFKSIFSYS